MSWQFASFLVLGAVLVGGFAWYERSRPPSQIVALVAALAALGVAGRVALAPIPNVVATTDIAIFSGYALGAAPGFAVGALAGVVSNFWLGQGPWTPWQMAAWGLCGVLGALLALGRSRSLGRIPLAAACGLAGVLYGAILNFSLIASYGGEMTLERFLALEARAVPFDAAHAIGNITLALVAGPAMIRMLVRFRERFEWTMRSEQATDSRGIGGPRCAPGALALLIAAALALLSVAAAPSAQASTAEAVGWLSGAQNRDGGFGASPGDGSSPEITGWVMLGLEAAGRNPLDVRKAGHSPVSYLRGTAGSIAGTGDLARTVLALSAAGVDPKQFAGRNLIRELRSLQRADGSFQGQVNLTAFGVIALRAGRASAGAGKSLRWLREAQNDDGGWGFVPNQPSDADSTGAALQAVRGSRAARRGVAYLRTTQRPSGGWPLAGAGTVNAQSTAWAVQGLIAAGASPGSVRDGGNSGLDYLAVRQASDGHYRYSSSIDQTPVWVTGQALIAAAEQDLPIAPVARAPQSNEAQGGQGTAGQGTVPAGGGGTVTGGGAGGQGTVPAGSGGAATGGGAGQPGTSPSPGQGSTGTGGSQQNPSGQPATSDGAGGGDRQGGGSGTNFGGAAPATGSPSAPGTPAEGGSEAAGRTPAEAAAGSGLRNTEALRNSRDFGEFGSGAEAERSPAAGGDAGAAVEGNGSPLLAFAIGAGLGLFALGGAWRIRARLAA